MQRLPLAVRRTRLAAVAACALAAAVGSLASAPAVAAGPNAIVTDHWAGPLHAPRGLKFGPDGYLYVAEGGVGGNDPVPPNCGGTIPGETVPPPIGPYTGSPTGSQISRIDTQGHVTPWVVGFPSSKSSMQSGFLPSGVADVAFVGDTMYAVLAGAGCTHGVPSRPNGVVRVNPDRSWTMIADLSAWQHAHPVAHPEEDDFEPDGTWYSMIAVRGDLYAVEPNHGDIVRVTTGGQIARVVDTSARLGHVVPTALAYHGNFYFGNLSTFNFAPGAPINTSNVWKMTPSGQFKVDEAGFNMVLGLAFDNRARMYVLEMTTGAAQPVPFTGRVTRVSPSGKREVIADGSDGLVFPTGIAIGPDGALYVSNQGFGPEFVFGPGSITRIEILD